MVPLHVLTLIVTGPAQPSVLVLEPVEDSPAGKSRIVPIWIGVTEASQLGVAIEHVRLPRPMTHDLFLDAMTNLDARVDHVVINQVKGQTFYAQLVLRQGARLIELDARPTDALALALRQEAPFYIEEDVLEKASFPYLFKDNKDEESELQEFRTFLEGIAPDDFAS
ncbi:MULTISPECIES: bifunctional nuclease family protein [unclassified Adlercreutzia]|uniref:bifunctional nuclease family protein n=1 Tax=unclassified Adlercreutzia TaxID=2636013 RepID=UPI0013ED1850|nr:MULTISPECIES: bifunctional nuclease family protein [unclassified Adlercreutzia]